MLFLRWWELRNFSWFLLRFLDSLEVMHAWRSGYDRYMEYMHILAMGLKVVKKYMYLVIFDIRDRFGDALSMVRSIISKFPQFWDRVRWSRHVFRYGQRLWCLHIQMCTRISFLIVRAISDSVFRTRVLHRIWCCS
jgi:hypothetical protein